jgi:hypothetical protein
MKARAGERIWKTGKQENRSFAGSVPVFLPSRFICSKDLMRSAASQVGDQQAPRYLLAPCQVRLAEAAEHHSAKTVRHFRSHPRRQRPLTSPDGTASFPTLP